jgi:hypothetical protein
LKEAPADSSVGQAGDSPTGDRTSGCARRRCCRGPLCPRPVRQVDYTLSPRRRPGLGSVRQPRRRLRSPGRPLGGRRGAPPVSTDPAGI